MTNEEYKVIRVTQATHGYLMDNRTSDLKTMGSVVGGLIEDKTKLEADIKVLEDKIEEMGHITANWGC